MEEIIKDENGWINGNIYNPRSINNGEFSNYLLLVCDESGRIDIHRPVSNGFPIYNFWWKIIKYPIALDY